MKGAASRKTRPHQYAFIKHTLCGPPLIFYSTVLLITCTARLVTHQEDHRSATFTMDKCGFSTRPLDIIQHAKKSHPISSSYNSFQYRILGYSINNSTPLLTMDPFHHLPTLSPRGVYILTSLGPAATVLTLNSATGSRPRVSGVRLTSLECKFNLFSDPGNLINEDLGKEGRSVSTSPIYMQQLVLE